jgi:uncharacterized protein YwqG|nr:YwqG family protein [Kofleriaceae bacterium]
MGLRDWWKRVSAPAGATATGAAAAADEATRRPHVAVTLAEPSRDRPRWSKIGGAPYVAVGDELPPDDLLFVAQVDCADVPALDEVPLPRTGLLQFWVGRDDLHGLASGRFRVAYVADASRPARDDVPASGAVGPLVDDAAHAMRFELASECAGADAGGHRIGGYCGFAQTDPRTADDPMVSLLQLDSGACLQWGDTGIAHWFIRVADLRALELSRVVFHWDCC